MSYSQGNIILVNNSNSPVAFAGAANGVHVDGVSGKVYLGGSLVEDTSIMGSGFSFDMSLMDSVDFSYNGQFSFTNPSLNFGVKQYNEIGNDYLVLGRPSIFQGLDMIVYINQGFQKFGIGFGENRPFDSDDVFAIDLLNEYITFGGNSHRGILHCQFYYGIGRFDLSSSGSDLCFSIDFGVGRYLLGNQTETYFEINLDTIYLYSNSYNVLKVDSGIFEFGDISGNIGMGLFILIDNNSGNFELRQNLTSLLTVSASGIRCSNSGLPNNAAFFKCGVLISSPVTLDTGNYIEVLIDNVLYKLALVN